MKILILGSSFLQLPYIYGLQRHEIFVIDKEKNSTIEDRYFVRYEKLDFSNVLETLLFIRKHGINKVINSTDRGVLYAEIYNSFIQGVKPKVDYALANSNKLLQRQHNMENNISQPIWQIIDTEYDLVNKNYPVIIKPLDLSGSRGVEKLYDQDQLLRYKEVHRDSCHLLEEVVSGTEYSVEGFCCEGHVIILGVTEKLLFPNDRFFVESGHVFPARIDKKLEELIVDFAKSLLSSYNLPDLIPFHFELMHSNSELKAIEIGFRPGGDFITTKLVALYYGVSYCDLFFYNLKDFLSLVGSNTSEYRYAVVYCDVPDIYGETIEEYGELLKNSAPRSSFERKGYKLLKMKL